MKVHQCVEMLQADPNQYWGWSRHNVILMNRYNKANRKLSLLYCNVLCFVRLHTAQHVACRQCECVNGFVRTAASDSGCSLAADKTLGQQLLIFSWCWPALDRWQIMSAPNRPTIQRALFRVCVLCTVLVLIQRSFVTLCNVAVK